MLKAIARGVSSSIARCELTFLGREPIDVDAAVRQHASYVEALRRAGADVSLLPADDDFPDGCFVEDTAVVLDQIAVLTRMGADSRRRESAAVETAIAPMRPLARIEAPATIDGGDVLVAGRTIFVGLTRRTRAEGARQLAAIAEPFGYRLRTVEPRGCLHLKSAVTAIDETTLLVNPKWIDAGSLAGFEILRVSDDEPWAANVLRVGEALFVQAGFPRTIDLVGRRYTGIEVLDISELRKAEAALTCLSLIVEN